MLILLAKVLIKAWYNPVPFQQDVSNESLGEFGIVYKGQLARTIGHVNQSETVAIKTLKGKINVV